MLGNKLFITVSLLSAYFFLASSNIFANSETYALKKFVGENISVVNYNVGKIQVGVPVSFNIRLYQIQDGVPVPFDIVAIKISKEGKVISNNPKPISANNDVEYSFTFPEIGQYDFEVDYLKGDQSVAQASYPLLVEAGVSSNPYQPVILAIIFSSIFWLGVFKLSRHQNLTRP